MSKVVVVGAGASGLVAAIYTRQTGQEVVILERNNICGKKILMTGNGKCNYFNENLDLCNYNSSHLSILKEIISPENKKEILSFFDKLGIVPKIKTSYYYPSSGQATSIRNALLLQANLLNVEIKYNTLVTDIKINDSCFNIYTTNGIIISDKLILATGSKAYPKTGSDGIGYEISKKLGHSIVEVLPALTKIYVDDKDFKLISGVRIDASLSLFEDNKLLKQEQGELQLTDLGISGICSFNLSSLVSRGLSKNKEEIIVIDFLPMLDLKMKMSG